MQNENENSNVKNEPNEQPVSSPAKYLTVIYHSETAVDLQSAGVTVFDLWALSVYVRAEAYNIIADMNTASGEKGITFLYNADGTLTTLQRDMSVLDLWGLSNYLKMRADEQYITVQTAQRMKDAANGKQIEVVHGMPGPAKKIRN